jgi:hypothetical protein
MATKAGKEGKAGKTKRDITRRREDEVKGS